MLGAFEGHNETFNNSQLLIQTSTIINKHKQTHDFTPRVHSFAKKDRKVNSFAQKANKCGHLWVYKGYDLNYPEFNLGTFR